MEKMQHFSIRKLSIGAASVLIGISFLGVKASTVKADSLQNTSATELTKSKTANEAIEQDISSNIEQEPASKADTKQDTGSNIKQEPVSKVDTKQDTGSDIKQEPVSKTDAKQINNDQPNADQTPVKPASPKPNSNQQNAADLEAKPQTPDKVKLQSNRTITPNKAGQSKVKVTNLMAIAGKKLNAQMLSESKVMSPAKDTNGGFDEATWGKLNVNDWTIKTLTDTDVNGTLAKSGNLELTSYNGDEQHVIIPNLLDIYNAGKADSAMIGNLANEDSTRVVISKDLLSQFSKNATSIAFSKTHTDHISNKDVDQMSNLTKTGIDHLTKVYSKDSDLSNAFSYFHSYDGIVSTEIYTNEAPRVKLDATNFDVSNVTNMTEAFAGSNYDGLSTIADWDTANATTMNGMFINANLSDLRFLSRWNTSNVTDMGRMFMNNPLLTNLVPIANWNTSNVTDMSRMFLGSPVSYADLSKWDFSKIAQYVESDGGAPGLDSFLVNYNDPSAYNNTTVYLGNNKTIPSWVLDMSNGMPNYCIFRANENTGNYVIITSDSRLLANSNGAYNHLTFTDNIGKQTKVDIPMAISTENATGDFASVKQRVLDFVNTEAAKQAAPTGKKWVMTDTDLNDPVKIANANFKLIDTSLPVLNTNDAYALDSKNGLHEHANVNDNGGYDKDFWGAIDLNNWNYAQDDTGNITLEGYKGSDNTKIIVPNIADFAHDNVTQNISLQVNPNVDINKVYISSSVMYDLAHNATRIGLSKTENKKVVASNAIWQDAFGGLINGPSGNNSDGGIKVLNPNLTVMDLHNLDTSNITNMSAMFNGGTNLKTIGDLSNWDTGHVTDMSSMFQVASSLTNIGNLNNWNISNVTDMSYMFNRASSLTNIGDLSKWDTGKVTNMSTMFQLASSLTNIGNLNNWNISNVTDMSYMFNRASSLTNIGDLSKWDTGKVTNMSTMFQLASNLTNIGDLNNWNTSNVTDMNRMFAETSNLTNIGNLSGWDTSKVTNMEAMFGEASNLTNIGNLDNWKTGNVTDMSYMFNQASNLINIGDLSKWDTSNVTDMSYMFNQASNLTNIGDLSKWDTGKVTNMQSMFQLASSLTNIGNLDNWNTGNVTDMSFLFSGTYNLANIGHLSKWNTSKVTNMRAMFNRAFNLTNIGNLDNWNTGNVIDMSYLFNRASGLTDIGNLDNWNTGNVIDMSYLFNRASNLTNIGNLDDWKTGNVTNMSWMFSQASKLTNVGDLSTWDTSKVTNMSAMFNLASSLINIGNLDNWNTGNVTDMSFLFSGTYNLANIGHLSKWNTSNVINMHAVFSEASSLTNIGNLDNWNTSKVTNMRAMFSESPNLTNIGDLSKWDTSEVTNMHAMFDRASNLTNIGDLSKWNTDNVIDMTQMFADTKSLHNLNISNWNLAKLTDKEALKYIFTNDVNLTVIANNITLPTWYDNELNNSDYFWNNHIAVITNNGKLLNATGDTDTLTIDNTQAARSIFYDSKGSSDAIEVLTDVNNQYIADYNKANPSKLLKLANTVDRNDPISLANASFVTVPNTVKTIITYHDSTDNMDLPHTQELSGINQITIEPSNLILPENYELDGNLPAMQYGTNYLINVKHKTAVVIQQDPATRTINVHLPNGTTKVYRQVVGYQRDVITDLVTKAVTHSKWTINDLTSSFTIDGIKQLEHPYVLQNGNYNYASVKLPQIPGYKTIIKTTSSLVNPARARFAVSFMALPKPVTPAINDAKPDKTISPATPVAIEVAKLIKTEAKAAASTAKVIDLSNDAVATTLKTIDLSNDAVITTPKEAAWQVADELDQDTYRVSNGKYTVELPHISNAQLHVIANDSTKDSVLFTYKGQNTKYVFKVKFIDGHYLLTTYKIKSGKLVKLIDYNFIKSSKMIDTILDWLQLK